MNERIMIACGDIVELKKQHPCGGKEFRVAMLGSDIKIVCLTCGKDIMLPRVKLEKQIKKIRKTENQ